MTRELISWLGLLSNEKKGQKLDGKVTQLIKQEDDPSGAPTLGILGIYSSADARKTTIAEETFVSLDDIDTVKGKL